MGGMWGSEHLIIAFPLFNLPTPQKYRGPGIGPGPIFLKMEALCVSVLPAQF